MCQTMQLFAQTPELVKNIHPTGSSDPEELIDFNGELFFRANDLTHGIELWHSDGTTSGTEIVLDINQPGSSWPENLTPLDDHLFFSATDAINGRELWMTDGTQTGTILIKDIHETGSSEPHFHQVSHDLCCWRQSSIG